MECFSGAHKGEVLSVACSSSQRNFVTGGSDLCVKLWDTRLSKKDFMSIRNPVLCDLSDVLLHHATLTTCVVCDDRLVFFDWRKPTDILSSFQHSQSISCVKYFEGGREDRGIVSVVDDDGVVALVDWRSACSDDATRSWRATGQLASTRAVLAPRSDVSRLMFGGNLPSSTPTPVAPFGSLDNICSGQGITSLPNSSVNAERHTLPTLWTVSMNSMLAGYQLASNGAMEQVYRGSVGGGLSGRDALAKGKQQLTNPPLPTCLTVGGDGGWIAIGRGDGTYSVLEVSEQNGSVCVDEVLGAPAHESNGLSYLQWLAFSEPGAQSRGELLSVALSGEITIWGVRSLLSEVPDDDDDDGGLPDVLFAESLRPEDGSKRGAVVNSCDHCEDGGFIVLGTTLGDVHLVAWR